MKQFNLRIPQDLLEEIRKLARKNERSVAGELRALIKDKIAASRPKREHKGINKENTTPAR